MAVNNKPIFTGTSSIGNATITNSTTAVQCFPASGSISADGAYIQKLRVRLKTASSTVSTVLRVYIKNDNTSTSYLFDEINIPITTISTTAISATFELPMNIAVPSGHSITVKYDTAPGTTTVTDITVFGGSYTAQA